MAKTCSSGPTRLFGTPSRSEPLRNSTSGTSTPAAAAHRIMACSLAGTSRKARSGSLTIQPPPDPDMGRVKRRPSRTTENLSWTPARENARRPTRSMPGSGPSRAVADASSSRTTTAPGMSSPSATSKGNERTACTPNWSATSLRRGVSGSGSRFENHQGTSIRATRIRLRKERVPTRRAPRYTPAVGRLGGGVRQDRSGLDPFDIEQDTAEQASRVQGRETEQYEPTAAAPRIEGTPARGRQRRGGRPLEQPDGAVGRVLRITDSASGVSSMPWSASTARHTQRRRSGHTGRSTFGKTRRKRARAARLHVSGARPAFG